MTAFKPVRGVPAGLRQVRFMVKAVKVPVVLARKTCPKELLLKQLNNVRGAEFMGFSSQWGGVGGVGYVSYTPPETTGVCATPPMLYAKTKSHADDVAVNGTAQLLSVAPLPDVVCIKEAVYPCGPPFQLKSNPMLTPLGPGPDATAAVVQRTSTVNRNRNFAYHADFLQVSLDVTARPLPGIICTAAV
jgi:hypothetical protein